jgi:hypothetical protein
MFWQTGHLEVFKTFVAMHLSIEVQISAPAPKPGDRPLTRSKTGVRSVWLSDLSSAWDPRDKVYT